MPSDTAALASLHIARLRRPSTATAFSTGEQLFAALVLTELGLTIAETLKWLGRNWAAWISAAARTLRDE